MNGNGRVARGSVREILELYGVKKTARSLASGVFFGICAYFAGLAELPFGARPFGVAYLAAAGREAIFVYFGLIISAFVTMELDEAIIYFAVYSALLLLRVFSRAFVELRGAEGLRVGAKRVFATLFEEKVGLRTVASAIFGVAQGAAILFAGGLLYYDLFGLLIITLLSPTVTLALCGYVEGRRKKIRGAKAEPLYLLGLVTLCSIATFGAREINIYGVSVSVLFALVATFWITCRHGVGYGAIGGLALGLCYSPMLSPLFLLSALCMGVLSRFSVALACFAAFFASCAWAFYIQRMSALLGTFGGILSACLLYSVVYRTLFVPAKTVAKEKSAERETQNTVKCRVLPDSALDGVKLYEMNARTSAISDGLYRLSLFFEDVRVNGAGDLSAHFCEENYNDAFFSDLSASEYKALSALLAKAMENEKNEYLVDRELSLRLCRSLTELNFEISGVLVYGVRKKTIYLKGKDREILIKNSRLIIEAVAPLMPFSVDFENFDIRRDGEKGGAMFISEREKNSASVVRRRVTARGEDVCGDSVSVFKNKNNRFFAFLSDGMGSGSSACAVSEISVGFLSNMLSSGALSGELIEMLNGFLCSRMQKLKSECSATLDLLELDLMNGHASVYKCGAAPSYIYRRGRLFKLRSKSMPIGILNEVDLKRFDFELSHGDVIVMVSDGVTGEGEECPWLFDLLAQSMPNRNLDRTAELIVKYATANGSSDDITVLLVRVE